jgi:antitoxin (DNA-binding transcriptional repressor) of toxin-antitoxin stability system
MNASIVDLRYKMSEVLDALERREKVTILYHGKVKGTIIPVAEGAAGKVAEHPFFGMTAADTRSLDEVMQDLRGGRFRAL